MDEAGDMVAKNFALTAKPYYAAASAGVLMPQYRLGALKLVPATSDIPTNVNFIVKGTVARDFMAANGVDVDSEPSETNLPAADVAERAQFYTTLSECYK